MPLQAMGVDLCSIYLADQQSDQYVLMATGGLAQDAATLSRIAGVDGLIEQVGVHQEPLNLANAFAHPKFQASQVSDPPP